jgi:serine/threonine-protein kinase
VSEDVLDRTTACLDRGRAELAALTQRWIDATDGKALALAGEAAEGLPRIAACSDTRALLERAPLPSDPALAAKIGEIRAELDRLYALSFSGRHEEIAAAMPALVAAADATGWSQVRAEALYLHGRTSQQLAKPEAEAQLLAANQLATESHDDRLAAEALVYLVLYLGNDERTAERAILVADLADAAIARVPDDPAMKAMLLRGRGDAHETLGKFAEARAAYEQALALVNARIGPTSRQAFEAQARIARVTRESGDVAEGRRLGEAALAGLEKAIGSDHPLIGATLGELAAAAYDLDDYDAAVDYLNRALAIIVRTTGEDSLPTATATQNLASTEFLRGKIEESKRLYERSLAIREHLLGPEHPLVAHSLMGLAQVNQWRGDFEQALDQLQHALAIITKRLGPDHPEVANALDQLGAALATNGKLEEALTYQRRARELRTRILGEDHPSTLTTSVAVAQTLVELKRCADAREILATAIPKLEEVGASPAEALAARGDCEFADGDARSAAATAQRAITACNATSETNPECGSMYWLRARALAKLRRRDEALAAAEEAERRAIANESPEDAAEIHAWIAAHRR